jgi:methionyl-tRNA formyltransferase
MKLASEEALLAGHTPADPGSYQRPVRPEDGLIDWTEPAELLDRRIRACQGTIWAHTFLSTMKLVVTEAEPVSLAGSGAPGTVERVDPDALVVRAALPTALLLRRFVFVGREHSAAELASRLNITPGVRLSADAPGPHQNTPP